MVKANRKNLLPLYFIPYVLVDFFVFGASYFYNKSTGVHIILLINVIVSLLLSLQLNTTIVKKLAFIGIVSLFNTSVSIVLLLLAMFLPGSKAHDYVMYNVCFPAIKKYYGRPVDQPFLAGEVDKDGWGKWWYQHTECEKNVYEGKGPIFSENPPGFVPVSK